MKKTEEKEIEEKTVFDLLSPKVAKLAKERFGKPTTVQELAIPKILDGKSILTIAGTGFGKTESVMLPVLSNLMEGEHKPISVLYITPMKSLNRDLLDRLMWWCNNLELEISVRHGDTSQYERKKQSEFPPSVLITTPETLQVLLVAKNFRNHLANVEYVIVDELHELVENKRGAQLTIGLERLKKLIVENESRENKNIQIIALSATVGSPELAKKFIGCDEVVKAITSKDLQLIVESPVSGIEHKKIAEKAFIGEDVAAKLSRILELIKKYRSTLIFTNTRESAEILSSRLRVLDSELAHDVHHSSLSKEVRIKAEKDFKEERLKALICLDKNSRILLSNGLWKNICDLHKDAKICSLNKNLKLEACKVKDILYKGKRDTVRIKTKRGFEIISTPNHLFLTIDENGKLKWKEISKFKHNEPVALIRGNNNEGAEINFIDILPDNVFVRISKSFIEKLKQDLFSNFKNYKSFASFLNVGLGVVRSFFVSKNAIPLGRYKTILRALDIKPEIGNKNIEFVGSKNYIRHRIPEKISPRFIRLLAFFLADGTMTRGKRLQLFNKNERILKMFSNIFLHEFGIKSKIYDGPNVKILEIHARWLCDTLKNIEVPNGRKARIVKIPRIVFLLPRKHRLNFLAGYFDGDGNLEYKNDKIVRICYNTYSEQMAKDIQLLLLSISSISSVKKNGDGFHVSVLGGKHLRKVLDEAGFMKFKNGKNISANGYSNADTIPNIGKVLKEIRKTSGLSTYLMQKKFHLNPYRYETGEKTIKYEQLKTLLRIYSNYADIPKSLLLLADSEIFWDKIDIAENAGKKDTYDILDAENSTFVANGFISHNCTSSLELGIDIGSIDLVVQYMSPRQVSKLTQRVGRSGHGVGRKSEGIIIGGEGDDIFESAVIARKTLAGELEELQQQTGALDVLANQIVGFAMAEYGVDSKKVFAAIKKSYPFSGITEAEFNGIVKFLSDIGLIWIKDSEIRRRRKAFEYYFENLSMIPDTRQYKVFDTALNQTVGSVDEQFIATHDAGTNFIVKGRAWRIMSIEGDKIFVEATDDITSAIPAWEGELIPIPFAIAQEVYELRSIISEQIKNRKSVSEISTILKKKYPVSDEAAAKMFALIERQLKKYDLPEPFTLETHASEKGEFVVMHSCFGTKVNETLARFVSTILSAKYGSAVAVKVDPYRILFKGCRAEDVKAALLEHKPEDVEILLSLSLPRTSLFKWRFIFVAKRFGAITKQAKYDKIRVDKIVELYSGSPIHTETLREIFLEKLDIARAKELLRKLQNGEFKIKEIEGLSPIAEIGFRYELSDVAKPERPEAEILKIFKQRLLDTKLRLICMNCGKYSVAKAVSEIENQPRCILCGSRLIAIAKEHHQMLQEVIKKHLKGKPLSAEEAKQIERVKWTAELALNSGREAILCLAGRGVGADTATRILAKPHRTEEDLFKLILEAERNFIKTKRFWS